MTIKARPRSKVNAPSSSRRRRESAAFFVGGRAAHQQSVGTSDGARRLRGYVDALGLSKQQKNFRLVIVIFYIRQAKTIKDVTILFKLILSLLL